MSPLERPIRALLFAPGSDQRKLSKLPLSGADGIVVDLEDAVAESEKDAARVIGAAAIGAYEDGPLVAARVNGIDSRRLADDVAAVVCPRLDALVVPKVQDPTTLREVDRLLSQAEDAQRIPTGTTRLIALIETALGVLRADEILLQAPARTLTAALGVADLSAELGVDLTPEGTELLYARSRLVLAARAAGMEAPIDGPYLRLTDHAGLASDCERSRALGFQGRVAVHPQQVETINRSYSALSDQALLTHRRVVEEFERAQREGLGAIRVDGRFVDQPVYELSRRRLRDHSAASATGA
ncbi:MAG: HpcH/HpaI aldolase/citrate lyase family protein [Solirubrobacteraceae bacterium]